MSKKPYVGNLSDDTTEEDFLGNCNSTTIITDKHTDKSKAFAFVEMVSQEETREVIKICSGVELDGKKLVVCEARPQPEHR